MRSLDLHGLTRAEAAKRLRAFLHAARRDGCLDVRVVHGVGTGALREVVMSLLAAEPAVKDYGAARPKDGGAGAVVVRLRRLSEA